MMKTICIALLCAALTGCATVADEGVISANVSALAMCPATPNCVCSQETDGGHRIEPLAIGDDTDLAWQALRKTLLDDPTISVITSTPRYIRAEAKTRLLRFTDDVEFLLDPEAGVIHMRSASRIGFSDLGKNRRRLEALRLTLREAGVVKG